jgi:hypothetical protein
MRRRDAATMTEIRKPTRGEVSRPIEAGLQEFEAALTTAMEALGLPDEGVLVPFTQRGRVLRNFQGNCSGSA